MKSIDLVLLILLFLVLIIGLKQSVLHLKGEGSCCGGAKRKIKKRRYHGKPIKLLVLSVDGMHCANCKNRIEANLQEIEGVECSVKLSQKKVTIKLYSAVDESLLLTRIANLGYKVIQ